MAGVRGTRTRRSGSFGPDDVARAAAVLQPGDQAHTAYRELIEEMGVSGAEVVRQAILMLHKQRRTNGSTPQTHDLPEAV